MLIRFGRNQHELLVRQLFHIRQTRGVADYIEHFASLVDQLVAYESRLDPLHNTMRFIDGLCDDLKAVVLIQWPSNRDTAYVLAQLHEVTPPQRHREFKRNEFSYSRKQDAPSHHCKLCRYLHGLTSLLQMIREHWILVVLVQLLIDGEL